MSSPPRHPDLVLASASPRRSDLLARLGLPFEVRPVDVEETFDPKANPEIVARRLAREKAEAARLLDHGPAIISADTVVWHEGSILGKPECADEARTILRRLRGETHIVITAVALMPAGKTNVLIRHPSTRVTMRDYLDAEIEAAIARGTPFDKAGGYAIQDDEFDPVATYDGCYCNVVGLPLWATIELFRRAELEVEVTAGALLPQCEECPLRVGHSAS